MKKSFIFYIFNSFLILGLNTLVAQTLPVPAPVFGTTGHFNYPLTPFAPNALAVSHAVQNDGKIILAGWNFESSSATPGYHIVMIRIDPVCGRLDSTFGNNGILKHKFLKDSQCNSIALQPDGKILGCGRIIDFSFFPFPATFRFNMDGSVDSTFNGVGYRTDLILNQQGESHALMMLNDGKFLVAVKGGSAFNHSLGVFKYFPNGQLDLSFGDNGRQVLPFLYAPNGDSMAAVLNPDSSVTVLTLVGSGPFGSRFISAGRITKSGLRDSTFNGNGYREYPQVSMENVFLGNKDMDAALLSDGRIVLSYGNLTNANEYTARLVAFLPNGDIDSSFAQNGIYIHQGVRPSGGGIYVDQNDRIHLFTNNINTGIGTVLRLLPTGVPDTAFGSNGLLTAPFGNQPDFRIFNDGFELDNGDLFAFGEINGNGFTATRFTYNPENDGLPEITLNGNELSTIGLGEFQWFLNNVAIEEASSNTYLPTSNGIYTVNMGFENCSFSSEPFELLTVGNQSLNSPTLKLRNNPTADIVYIDNVTEKTIWNLIDIDGKVLLSGATSENMSLDLRFLNSGVYVLKCLGNKHLSNFKVIKR